MSAKTFEEWWNSEKTNINSVCLGQAIWDAAIKSVELQELQNKDDYSAICELKTFLLANEYKLGELAPDLFQIYERINLSMNRIKALVKRSKKGLTCRRQIII